MASLKDLIVLGPARFLDKLYGNLEGNASTATKLQTPRAINGTNFDGTGSITTANWGTARTITISDNSGTNTQANTGINGSTNFTLKLPATIKANLSGNANTATTATYALKMQTYKYNSTTETYGTSYPLYAQWNQQGNILLLKCDNYIVNTDSATKLQTARTINGTNFDGTGNITTANWGTARNFTIGNSTKSVNGSAAMSWSLSEIGAVARAGDTMNGSLTGKINNTSWIGITRNGAFRTETAASLGGATAVVSMKTASGSWAIGNVTDNNYLYFVFGTDENYNAGTNTTSNYYISTNGAFSGSASKLTTARTINGTSFDGSGNITTSYWGTARTLTVGNTGKSVNGSGNVSWSIAEIGAVNKTGDTMSGRLTLNTSVTDHGAPTDQILVINCSQVPSGTTLTDKNAPGIGFHIGGNSWGSLILRDGSFKFVNSSFNGYMPVYASTFYGALSGNASSATKLQTARTINGTNFDGTGNITTANWGTARTLTIGNTGKSVNGSSNISWSLAEIGAVPKIEGSTNGSYTVYRALGNIYKGGTAVSYYRIALPQATSWGMFMMKLAVRESYNSGSAGEIIIYANHSSSADWNQFFATCVGNLSTNIKVYGSDKKYFYIGGSFSYGGLSIELMTVGDSASTINLSNVVIDIVTALPSTYQTATMCYSLHSNNYTTHLDSRYVTLATAQTITATKTLTSNWSFKTTNYTSTPIQLLDDSTTYGHTMLVGAGGTTYIGAGEASSTLYTNLGTKSTENLILGADNLIQFYPGADNATATSGVTLSASNQFFPQTNNTGSLGTSGFKWGSIYSNKGYFGGTSTTSYALNTSSFICDSWIRTKGGTGWYNETYAGGWYMEDATYIKAYNNKKVYVSNDSMNAIYTAGAMRAVKGFTVDETMTVYPSNQNELNFGGSNNSSTIYFGYRALDSRPIPTKFVFGSSGGTANLQCNTVYLGSGTSSYVSSSQYTGNAATASKITNITTTDQASSSDVWRRIWFSYSDNATGRPAYDDRYVIQTSTGILKAPTFSASSGKYYGRTGDLALLIPSANDFYYGSVDSSNTSGNDEYRKGAIRLLCTNNGNFNGLTIGRYHPNSHGILIGDIYSTSTVDSTTGLPQYSTFWASNLAGSIEIFGTSSYNYYHRTVLDSSNYTSYTVTKTGSGASGTWGIGITGNAATATAFSTNRTIALTGDVTGSASTNGSSGWSISTTVVDDSHNHSYLSGWSDTRNVATTPNDYNRALKVVGIKTATGSGTLDGSSYSTLVGIRGWGDSSGGNSHELAFTGNGGLYRRHGATTTWSSWFNILDSNNYTSYTVTKTGSGASGTWSINVTGSSGRCTGNAATATTLSSTLALNKGGTGATTKTGAKTNLGITYGTTLPTSGMSEGDIFFKIG